MRIYNNIKRLSLAILACGALTSCSDFLTENCQKALTEEEIYADLDYTELNLQGIYTKWRECWKDEHFWIPSVGTDEIQSGAYQALKSGAERGALDKYDANLNSLQGKIEQEWNLRWAQVTAAAKIIRVLNNDDLVVGSKEAQLVGEASFIRGFLDYELAMYWGRIPTIDLEKILNGELGYGRQSLEDTWKFIIADLERAAKYTPKENTPGRATCYAAYTILGKAYMSAPIETGLRDFNKAKAAFEEVIKGGFQLVDYADLWDYKITNTKESIWELQFNVTTDFNQIQFQIGSRAVQSYFGDQCYFSGYDHAVPTEYAYSDIEDGGLWEEGDIRRDENIRYNFTYYGQTPDLKNILWEDLGDDHDELKPHIKKYEDFRTDSHSGFDVKNMWKSGKNIPVLRYADVLLSYAECLNELGQTAEAVTEVNKVRERAWEFDLPTEMKWDKGMSQEDFRTKIMDERMRELFGEKWRKIDLLRTGKFVELTKERNKWTKMNGTIDQHNIYWPIPDSEIKLNPDITDDDQNEGYR